MQKQERSHYLDTVSNMTRIQRPFFFSRMGGQLLRLSSSRVRLSFLWLLPPVSLSAEAKSVPSHVLVNGAGQAKCVQSYHNIKEFFLEGVNWALESWFYNIRDMLDRWVPRSCVMVMFLLEVSWPFGLGIKIARVLVWNRVWGWFQSDFMFLANAFP